jgi:hypothetical protein
VQAHRQERLGLRQELAAEDNDQVGGVTELKNKDGDNK